MYTPKESDFYTHGYLTSDQFIKAGDQLTKTGFFLVLKLKQDGNGIPQSLVNFLKFLQIPKSNS